MDINNLTSDEIFGLFKEQPGFLIRTLWDNNSTGLQLVLNTYGRPIMNGPEDILKLLITEINSGQATGQQWAEMLGKVPYSPTANNYTKEPEFVDAFWKFDNYMGIKN